MTWLWRKISWNPSFGLLIVRMYSQFLHKSSKKRGFEERKPVSQGGLFVGVKSTTSMTRLTWTQRMLRGFPLPFLFFGREEGPVSMTWKKFES
jgi:hypothetical protein